MPGDIEYKVNVPVSADQFIDLLERSTLARRRPVEDRRCIEGMTNNTNLMISAWQSGRLVGVVRSVTDFHYACYLSDLAVDTRLQRQGIGIRLQQITQEQLGPRCTLILIAAPAANDYYHHIGFSNNTRCWILDRSKRIQK